MNKITELVVEGIPRSVDFSKFLLIGLRNGLILECDIDKVVKETVMHSHPMGEVWGLCVIEERNLFVTSCDDNKIIMYDEMFMSSRDAKFLKLNIVGKIPDNVFQRVRELHGQYIKYCL